MKSNAPLQTLVPPVAASPYSQSGFRLLGLTADATVEEIAARGEELLAAAGRPPARPEPDMGWLLEVRQDPPLLREVLERFQREDLRLYERLFWFHVATAVDAQALTALKDGRSEAARDLWRQAWREGEGFRATAALNLAVLHHSRALSAPRGQGPAHADLELARRWWRHVVEGGKLTLLITQGEPAGAGLTLAAERVERRVLAQMHELLTPVLLLGRGGDPAGLPEPGGGGDLGVGRTAARTQRGLMLAAMEEAEEAARRGDRQSFEDAVDRARDTCPTPRDQIAVEKAFRELARRLVCRCLRPVRVEPVVLSVSGLGTGFWGLDRLDQATRSYETTLMFTVAHLPVLPLGRYRVAERDDGTYDFLGRLPMDGWIMVHYLVLAGILMMVLWGSTNLSHLSAQTVERLRRLTGTSSDFTELTPRELDELRRSPQARAWKKERLDARVVELQAERLVLWEQRIPDLERSVALDRKHKERGEPVQGALGRQADLDEARLRCVRIGEEIRKVRAFQRRIEKMGGAR